MTARSLERFGGYEMAKRNGTTQSNGAGQNGRPSKSLPSSVGSAADKQLAKVTLYVRPDQVLAIEAIQLEARRRTGSRPDKSTLVQEALDLLIGK
jgi:hypothetical protein